MVVGTVGIQRLEGLPWLKAFYFMSMIATGQGTNFVPGTDAGMIFLSVMSFVSVGIVVAALGFLFGPFFGVLFKIGVEKIEEEIKVLKKKER